MDRSVFVSLLLSGLFWSSSAQYHFINERMSWSEAQNYCRQRSTDLVTVDAMEDVEGLMDAVDAGYAGSVWIGLKMGTQKRWGWSNGENTQYFYWGLGQPNSDGDCVVTFEGVWYDDPCDYKQYFVCYKENVGHSLIQSDQTWSEAQSYCRQNYTDLVTIHNAEENQEITNILLARKHTWIGRFRDTWEWSDQSNVFFRYWAAGQPSGSGDCVAMSTTDSGKWISESCDLQHPFICSESFRQIVRLQFSCNGKCTLNDPSLEAAIPILNEISEKLTVLGLKGDRKISWRKTEGEKVFHEQINHTANSKDKCDQP